MSMYESPAKLVHGEGTSLSRVGPKIGFVVAAPWTNLPQCIVFGWAWIGFAVMANSPYPYHFGHT